MFRVLAALYKDNSTELESRGFSVIKGFSHETPPYIYLNSHFTDIICVLSICNIVCWYLNINKISYYSVGKGKLK